MRLSLALVRRRRRESSAAAGGAAPGSDRTAGWKGRWAEGEERRECEESYELPECVTLPTVLRAEPGRRALAAGGKPRDRTHSANVRWRSCSSEREHSCTRSSFGKLSLSSGCSRCMVLRACVLLRVCGRRARVPLSSLRAQARSHASTPLSGQGWRRPEPAADAKRACLDLHTLSSTNARNRPNRLSSTPTPPTRLSVSSLPRLPFHRRR